MTDDNVDAILPILQRIQADLAEVKTDVRSLRGQVAALRDLSEARFTTIEHVLLDLSARVYVLEQRDRS